MENAAEVIPQFSFAGTFFSATKCSGDQINDTFILTFTLNAEEKRRYILQRINKRVFRYPERVVENIEAITRHLHAKITERGGFRDLGPISAVPTVDGGSFYQDSTGEYWRAFDGIASAEMYRIMKEPGQLRQVGKILAEFQQLLADFPADTLNETIERFHDTRKHFLDFVLAVENDPYRRVKSAGAEISFASARKQDTGVLVDLMAAGAIPLRVTHSSIKPGDMIAPDQIGEGMLILDMDLVMPGTILFDYGNSVCLGACTVPRDGLDLAAAGLNLCLFTQFTQGYLTVAKNFLCPAEIEHLAFAVKLAALERGIRMLTDYLTEEQQPQVSDPGCSLNKARIQLKLAADIEAKQEEMERIIAGILNDEPGMVQI